MLGLTELDDMICLRLSRHDLARCARVSKKWHSVVIPHLWYDASWISLTKSYKNRLAFCRMVREDYRAEQQQCQVAQKKEDDMDESSQPHLSLPSSTLSKYGHWIQKLPNLENLEIEFRRAILIGQDKAPTTHELLLHLFKRCSPKVQVDTLSVNFNEFSLDSNDPVKMVLDFCLPRLHRLVIQGGRNSSVSRMQKLMDLLDLLCQHTTTLEILELSVDSLEGGTIIKEDQIEDGSKGLGNLKMLFLNGCTGRVATSGFLFRLLKKCSNIKGLQVNNCPEITQPLVEGISTYLLNLDEIIFGYDYYLNEVTRDDMIGQLLSGTRKEWRIVRFRWNAQIGWATMNALSKHFSTLEILYVDGCHILKDNYLVQVLSSSTNLHTLSNDFLRPRQPTISAESFIDMDPDTGSLKPWHCEKTLKAFGVTVTGIPRPDLNGNNVLVEAHPGQSQELHGQVYDRLARLTNLETLGSGNQCYRHLSNCLDMSLESGLDKLSGLIKLEELDVTGMRTRIGVKEVQWMVEHWPKLRAINGLHNRENEEALRWLRENRPDIGLKN